jgi:hypothetical protein
MHNIIPIHPWFALHEGTADRALDVVVDGIERELWHAASGCWAAARESLGPGFVAEPLVEMMHRGARQTWPKTWT